MVSRAQQLPPVKVYKVLNLFLIDEQLSSYAVVARRAHDIQYQEWGKGRILPGRKELKTTTLI